MRQLRLSFLMPKSQNVHSKQWKDEEAVEDRKKIEPPRPSKADVEKFKNLGIENGGKRGIIELREKENSTKQRKKLNKDTFVDLKHINSSEYKARIDKITDSTKESRMVLQSAKEILKHRSGTLFEDLAYINTETGKTFINKSYDYYKDGISACKPNKEMEKMLSNARPNTIIGVHNHPQSTVPSVGDIGVAFANKYKCGVVLCHNGDIYKYKVDRIDSRMQLDFTLNQLNQAVYNKDNQVVSQCLEELRGNGIEMEVLTNGQKFTTKH